MTFDLATIKLFNSVLIESTLKSCEHDHHIDTINYGYILSNAIYHHFTDNYVDELITDINNDFLSDSGWNNAFYKSWEKVASLSEIERFRDQILHYITTYGFESLGIDSPYVYIPEGETVLNERVKFRMIHGITEAQLKEKIIAMVSSGIALGEETQTLLVQVIGYFDSETKLGFLALCKNKELMVRLASALEIVPVNPTEFLRCMIYFTIGSTLVIKSTSVLASIEEMIISSTVIQKKLKTIFDAYEDNFETPLDAYKKLAESFNRYKPLWLVFKKDVYLARRINKISKLSKKYHKPIKFDYLNNITTMLKEDIPIYQNQFKIELEKVNSFRKIRLLNALYNMKFPEKNYLVRNGKSFATKKEPIIEVEILEKIDKISRTVRLSIVEDLKKNVEGKSIYMPTNFHYSLPTSEKNFIGNIPIGSFISIEGNALIGIHWDNLPSERVDLDLSSISITGEKVGWNGEYSTRSVMYSGDITDAFNGASEFLHFKNIEEGVYLVHVNPYTTNSQAVPFKLIVGKSDKDKIPSNYIIDMNEVIHQSDVEIDNSQITLGLVKIYKGIATFYFLGSKVNGGSIAHDDEFSKIRREVMINSLDNEWNQLRAFLFLAGANLLEVKKEEADIDLEELDKSKIIELFSK